MAPKRSREPAAAETEVEAAAAKAKGKAKAKRTALPVQANVKKEGEVCINNLGGKQLQNAICYKLKQAPAHIREFYDSNMKNLKMQNSTEKQEFVQELLNAKSWKSTYFERCHKISNENASGAWASKRD
eukprot:10841510-Lingulodinium_polyedra.AAC.2